MTKKIIVSLSLIFILAAILFVLDNATAKQKKILKSKHPVKDVLVSDNNIQNNVQYNVDLQKISSINHNISGLNTAFAFSIKGVGENSDVSSNSALLRPTVLRFPGGTLANYYHPGEKGYGIKKSEVKVQIILQEYINQQKLTTSALDEYIHHAKPLGVETLVVANLLTGTPEETVQVIDTLKSNGLEVSGVELGNELYFGEYRYKFPDVDTYITKAKEFSRVIKMKYPEVKVGVLAAKVSGEAGGSVGSSGFATTWNTKLGQETFYDSYIVHGYVNDDSCTTNLKKAFDEAFVCEKETLAVIKNDYISNLRNLVSSYFNDKKMWYTEWNIKSPQNLVGNTITHAGFVLEMLINMNDFNQESNNVLEYASYHNYLTKNYGYGALVLDPSGKINTSGAYEAFKLFNTISARGAKNVSYTQTKSLPDFSNRFFYSPTEQKLFMLFVNKTGQAVSIGKISGFDYNAATMTIFYGDKPYASFGKTGFAKDFPDRVLNVRRETKAFTGSIDGGYSIGLIEFTK